jgi:tetratricopeptide (TPR) repeat protein
MARTRERLCALIALVALSATTVPAYAQPSGEGSQSDAVFKRGLDQYAQGNHTAAVATWENLLATLGSERGYKIFYNLALAYEKLGDVTRAIERHSSFLRHVEQHPDVDVGPLRERIEDSRSRRGSLRATHGAVDVQVPNKGGLVMTRVGSAEPRAAGYVVWLAPGTHTVELFVGTERARTITVEVKAEQTITVDTSPPAESAPDRTAVPVVAPAVVPEPDRGTSSWVYAGAAATVASIALPITLFLVADGKRDDADSLGTGHTGYSDAASSYEKWRTAYLVSYALPIMLASATGVAWWLGGRRAKDTRVSVGAGAVFLDGRF